LKALRVNFRIDRLVNGAFADEIENGMLTTPRESGKNALPLAAPYGAACMLLTLKTGWYKMFAVVKTGGKQYKVAQGDVIQVEKLDVEAGKSVDLNEVLMVCDEGKLNIGSPLLVGAKVTAEVVAQERTGKLIIFKKKRRQNYRRKNNHRQAYTVLKIKEIKAK